VESDPTVALTGGVGGCAGGLGVDVPEHDHCRDQQRGSERSEDACPDAVALHPAILSHLARKL